MASRGIGINLSLPLDDRAKAALLARLEARTEKTATCWIWLGGRHPAGYGQISVRDFPTRVHVLSFAIHHGPIPVGQVVRHDCDVPPCWRPDHLLLGTQIQNIGDMRERGRAKNPPITRGEAHPKATLSDAELEEIRAIWVSQGADQRGIAARFGVSQSTVWRIIHHQTRGAA